MLLWMSAGSPKELIKVMIRHDRGFQVTVGVTAAILLGAGVAGWRHVTSPSPMPIVATAPTPAMPISAPAPAPSAQRLLDNPGIECHASGQEGLAVCHVLVLRENGKQEDLLLLCGEHPPGPYGQPGGPGCRIVSSP